MSFRLHLGCRFWLFGALIGWVEGDLLVACCTGLGHCPMWVDVHHMRVWLSPPARWFFKTLLTFSLVTAVFPRVALYVVLCQYTFNTCVIGRCAHKIAVFGCCKIHATLCSVIVGRLYPNVSEIISVHHMYFPMTNLSIISLNYMLLSQEAYVTSLFPIQFQYCKYWWNQ